MAKILHTADTHLGTKLSGLGKSGDKVRAALKESFTRMIDLCLEHKVDAFVIAGDLFDSNRVSKSLLDFAMREIARLEQIPTVLIPGTHDFLEENSIYATLDKTECPENLYVFDDPEKNRIEIPEKELTFYANPNTKVKSEQSPLHDLKPDSAPGYHIALAHGSLAIPGKHAKDDYPIPLEEIESSGFDYVALGHWHSYMRAPTTKVPAAYCGNPEPLSFKQKDAGWVAMVELNKDGVKVEKISVGKLEWKTIELNTNSFKYTIELERELSKYVSEERLLKVLLTGIFPSDGYIDFDQLTENMADQFMYLKIINRSESVPDDFTRLAYPETTILGQYINLLNDEIKNETDQEKTELLQDSLKLGYALLSGKDVL